MVFFANWVGIKLVLRINRINFIIIFILGFNDLSGINNQDQLTLCIIENYLDFKLSEVFKEINIELQLDGIQPIPPDQEALDTILRAADDRVLNVNMNQKLLANTFKQQEFMQEKEFYYEVVLIKI